ncbi:hypothetical protein FT452_08990, partial [Campylobacter jejuni]|nr:hypothetical protein [Campylobacter jejuni]
MQDKLIVAARSDGLGERFLGILNALYLCNLTGCKFGYIWNDGFSYISEEEIKRGSRRNEGMDIPSEIEIFNDNFINKYSLKDKLLDCNGNNFSGSAGPFLKSGKYNLNFFNLKSEYSWGWSSSSFDLSKIFEDIDVKHYHRHLQLLWNWLNDHFSANLKEFISSIYTIIKTRLSNNYIGFHIRSGGIIYEHRISALYGIRKALPIHITLELIKQYSSSGNKVLLFGDDVETLKQIRLFLENDNIYLIDDLVQVDLLSNFEISLSEIVLMANSSRIFSSGKSAFSIFASKIGNIDNISLYTHIAKLNQVDLIKKYINLINIHNLQKSYSLSYLFDLYEELNLNTNESEQYVKAAIDYDPDNIYYKIKYVYILLKNQKYDKAD